MLKIPYSTSTDTLKKIVAFISLPFTSPFVAYRVLKTLVIAVVLIASAIGFLLLSSESTEAGWWDDNWNYRKKITVTNNTSAENNVYVTLSSYNTSDTSRYQADCGDIRFTKENGQVMKYYLVSGCGGASTTIHIQFDTLAVGGQNIYLYYGNGTATNGTEAADFSTAASNATVGTPASEETGPGPVAYWGMDEATGTIAHDSSENAYNGTLTTSSVSGSGTAVKIDDAGDPGVMSGSGRQIVRTSSGTLYAFINDGGSCEIWKSTDGSTWTEQDQNNNPLCATLSTVTVAIDGNNTIHLAYWDDASIQVQYRSFSSDTFGSEENVFSGGSDNGQLLSIAIDSSNVPHIAHQYIHTGSPETQMLYSNRFGGAWTNSGTQVELGEAITIGSFGQLTIDEDNIPEIVYSHDANTDLTAALGNGNNATGFTLQDIDTDIPIGDLGKQEASISIDESGNTWVSYVDENGASDYVTLVKHNDADAWTTWQTPITNSNAGKEPSLAINGTDVYVFYQEENNDVAYDKYSGSWSGETILSTGTFQDIKTRYSFLNNPSYATYGIDYLYSDATDIWYNKLSLGGSNPTWETSESCIESNCLQFDGTSSYVDIGTGPTAVKSVSFWVWPNATTEYFIDLNGSAYISASSGTISATGFTSPTIYVDGVVSSTITANTWHQVTVTTGTGINATDLDIGRIEGVGYLQGFIDEVKLYPYVRSAADVKSDFAARGSVHGTAAQFGDNGPSDQLDNGLLSWWKLDESSGNASDSSGNSLTLTNNGTTTFVPGKYANGSEHVPASSQYLSTATTISGVKAVSFWTNPDSTTNYYISLTSGAYITSSSGTLSATGLANAKIYVNGSESTTIAADTWQHVVVTFDSINADQFYIGRQGSNYYDGTMDEVRVYNRTLLSQEVAALSHQAPGPVSYWSMDDDSDSTLIPDISGNDHTFIGGTGTLGTPTLLANGSNGQTGSQTQTTTSFSPTVGKKLLIYVFSACENHTSGFSWGITASAGDTPTVKQTSSVYAMGPETNFNTQSILYELTVSSSGSRTFTFDANSSSSSAYNYSYAVIEVDNGSYAQTVVANGANINPQSSSASGSLTLGSNPVSGNLVMAFAGKYNLVSGALSTPTSYNTLINQSQTYTGVGSFYRNDTTSPTVSFTDLGQTVGAWSGFVLELAASTTSFSWSPGKYGSSLSLDGAGFAALSDDADLDFGTGSFTIAGWVNHLTMSGGADYILTKSQIGTNGGYQVYMASDGDIVFEIDDDSAWGPDDSATTTAATYDDGAWHHIAAVKNETTGIYVYVDGVLIGSDTSIAATGTLTNDDPLNLGIGDDESSGGFAGKLDDIRIYNYARTPGQIIEDMNGGHPLGGSPVGSEVAYWGFDEGSLNTCSGGANDFCDQSINGNDLALGQTTAGYTTNGKFGLAFDGSATYWASRADDDDFDVGIIDDLTVSLWFRSDAASLPGATEYLVNKSNATTQGYALYTTTAGYVCFGIDDDGSWGPDIASCNSTNLYDASWHHVVGVRDHSLSDKTYVYVDGRLADNDSDTTTATLANTLSLYVKDDDGDSTNSFAGDIDELKIYRGALTGDEVLIDYSHGGAATLGSSSTESDGSTSSNASAREYCVPGDVSSCSGPVGEWDIDEGTGTTSTYDTSGNGRTGSLMSITQTAWSPGKHGSSLKLDGSADYVDIGTGPSTVKTATFWVYPETTTEYFLNFTSTTDYIWLNNGVVTATGFTSPSIYVNGLSGTSISAANKWYYVAVTSSTAENASNFDIGRVADALYLQGKIDQVRLYDYARTPAQIAWEYNKGQSVAYYALDECQGSTAYNSIADGNGDPSGNNGTIYSLATGTNTSVGTCSSGNGNEMWDNGTTGKLNGSLEFDDTNDYVQVADANTLDLTSGLSISAWVNTDASEADNVIVSKGTSYEVGINADGDIYWEGVSSQDDASTKVTSGSWHHVVVTNDDTTITYYVDGVKTGTDASGVGADNTTPVMVGADGTNYFDGQIDEVKVWNYVLTGEQVVTDYNLGAAVRFSWDARVFSLIGSLIDLGKNIPPDVPPIVGLVLLSLVVVKQRGAIGHAFVKGKRNAIIVTRKYILVQRQVRRKKAYANLLSRKQLARVGVASMTLTAVVVVFLVYTSDPTDAWFNDNWQYRKQITITNNTSSENNVYVTLSSYNTSDTSRYQTDCGDIRFTKTNGQLLKYYVVSGCGTSSTTLHILLDTFAAGKQDVYLYYGNPTVENGFEAADFSTVATNASVGSPASEEKGPGPSASWTFDEGYGTTANDSTENNADGTLGGIVPGATNIIEQQIEIINQEYSTTGTAQPTDNSLGMITWDGTKYNGEAVYFEAIAYCSSCTGGNTEVDVTLYTSAGSAVSASTISTTATGYTRIRTASDILSSLSNGTDYTVRITRDSTGGTAYIKTARLIVVQTAGPITDTQTQVEMGTNTTTTFTSSTAETLGAFDSYNNADASYTSTAKLTATTFVTAYQDVGNSSYGTAVIGSVSGTTISYGPENEFNTASTIYISVAALDSTHFVVAYRDSDTFGTAIVGLVSGTTISSYGAENVFNSAATTFISVAALDSTHFVVTYQDAGNSSFGTGIVGVTDGSTTISSYGAENVFNSASTVYVSVAALDSTHFVVAYVGTSSFGTGIVGVTSGTTISSYGAENVFNSASTAYTTVAVLDSTHFVAVYQDLGNSNFGTALVGVTDGSTTISSYGAENVFNSASTLYTSVAVLDSTHFAVAYQDGGNSNYGTGIVGLVSGTTISSYGAENVFNSAAITYYSVASLDSTHFVVAYRDSNTFGTAIVGLVSGTTISSYGTENPFNSAATIYTATAVLDSTHIVVAYQDAANTSQGTAVVGSVSGNTITYGNENVFNSGTTQAVSVAALDSTHFVVAYQDFTNSSFGTAIVGVTSGTTISSYGAENVFNSASTSRISVSTLDSTHFVVAYQDTGNSSFGTAMVGVTDGSTTISSYGAENVFNAATTDYISVAALDSTHFVVAYDDNLVAGTAIVGVTSGTTISSYGAENIFHSDIVAYTSVAALDATHFVVAYQDGNTANGTMTVGLTNGSTTISSYGTESVFYASTILYPSVAKITTSSFVIAAGYSATNPFGKALIGTTASTITDPHYYTYDNSQYSGTKTAYFEATLKSGTYSNSTSAGPRSATASSDCTETANGDAFATVTWTSPGNAFSNNTTYATASVDGTATEWLTCTNFGFSLPATTASIDGIVVEAEVFSSSTNNGGSSDYQARIIKGGSIGSTDRAAAGAYGTSADVYISHGTGTTDLWGNTWSYSDINASNFGFALSVQKASGAGAAHTVSVDNVRITVYYTDNATGTAYAELYNRTDAAVVTNSTISVNSTSWDLVRSSALTTNWDTSSADEYEVRIYTSNASATAYITNAKIIIDQTDSGGLTDIEVIHTYNNTSSTDSDTTYTSQNYPNRLDKSNFSGGSYAAYFESTLMTSSGSNAYFAQLDYNGGTGQVTASDIAFTRKRSADIWSSLPGSATNVDVQLKNASTSTTTSSGSWLIIQASGLDIGSASTTPDWKEGTDCIAGKCVFFDGSADDVVVNNQSAIDLNEGLASEFTIAFWMRANSLGESNVGEILNKGASTYARLAAGSNANVADLQVSLALATSNSTLTIDDGVSLNGWHQVFIQYADDGDDEITVYIDGVQRGVSTTGSGAPSADTSKLLIGGSTSANYHGFLDEFKIYPYVRTADELKTDHVSRGSTHGIAAQFGDNGAMDHISDGLIGYWKLDESSGNAADSSGNGTTLTDGSSSTYAGAKYGNGVDFESSSSDYLSMGDSTLLSQTGDITISAWIKPESVTAATEFVIAGKWDGVSESYLFEQYGDEIQLRMDSSADYVTTNTANLAAGSWYHVAGVFDSTHAQALLYVNGREEPTTTTGTIPSSITDDTGRFSVGAEDSATGGANYYDGIVDEVRLYNRVLDPSEIQALSKWAPEALAHWKLDEGTGTSTVADYSGNAHTLTMNSREESDWMPGAYGKGLLFNNTQTTGTSSGPVKIDDPGDPGSMAGRGRQVVRSSSGNLYAFINDGGSCEIWKSASGASWAQQGSSITCTAGGSISAAIDSTGLIHLLNVYLATNLQYTTFDTSTDTFWGTTETVYSGTDSVYDNSIAVDSSDVPHVAYTTAYAVGSYTWFRYENRIGGTWSRISIDETSTINPHRSADIVINEDDIPEVIWINNSFGDLETAVGDQNDVTSFTEYTLDSDIVAAGGASIGVDSLGNTWVAFLDNLATDYISLYKHSDADGWTTWQSAVNDAKAGTEPSLVMVGTSVYVFYQNSTDDIVYGIYTGSWSGETTLQTGTFLDAHTKWAYFNNNRGSVQLDYLYSDGTDIYWATLALLGTEYDDTLSRSDDSYLDFTASSSFSISLWVKHDTALSREYMLTKADTTNGGYKLYMDHTGDICFVTDDDSTWDTSDSACTSGINYDDSVWHHIVGSKAGTSKLELYVDGALVASDTSLDDTGTLENGNAFFIGVDRDGTGSIWNGFIDDIRIYNSALSTKQVTNLKNGYSVNGPGVGSPLGHPIAYWAFDEGYAVTARDSTTNSNNLSFSSSSWYPAGKKGLAWDGNGTAYLFMGDDADFDFASTDGLSITGWFEHGAASATEYIVYKQTGNAGYAVYMDSDGDIVFGIGDTGGAFPEETIGASLGKNYDDNTWHHFAAVKDGTTGIYLYVDGVLVDRDISLAVAGNLSNSAGFFAGDSDGVNNGDEFNGEIDELKVYRFAVTSDEVKLDRTQGSAVVLGSSSTASDGTTSSNASAREYCIPGDITSCNGPVGEWKMDEKTGTTANDASGNDNALTLNIDRWAKGKFGGALRGAGINWASRSDDVDFDFTASENFTISGWFQSDSPTNPSGGSYILAKGTVGSIGYNIRVEATSGRITFGIQDDTGVPLKDQATSPVGTDFYDQTWHYFSGVKTGTTKIELFIDGILQATDSTIASTGTLENAQPLVIGDRAGDESGDEFVGNVDNVKIYRSARTPAQIAWEYNKGEPLAYYALDECQGSTAYNSIADGNGDPSGNNGTIYSLATGSNTSVGTCSSGAGTEMWDNGTTGKIGASLDFDGTNDYMQVEDATTLDLTSGLSIAAWVNVGTSDANNVIVSKGASYEVGINADGDIYWEGADAQDDASAKVTTGTWHHIAITNDDTTIAYYVDGVKTGIDVSGIATDNTTVLMIASDGTNYFDGRIDEAKIWNHTLTPVQIRSLYNNGAVRFD